MSNSSHYNPNQPRLPKGHSGGGQWTSDGHSSFQVAFAGLPVRASVAARTAAVSGVAARMAIGRALVLYTRQSLQNNRNKQAVIEINAREYAGLNGIIDLASVRVLNEKQVRDKCEKFGDVQSLTDNAAVEAAKKGPYARPADYGTAVHADVAEKINGPKDPDNPTPIDPNFRAEVSYLKMKEDGVEIPKDGVKYGRKNSIRVDVFEKTENGTVCVYDIKTGKRGLSPARFLEIVENVYRAYPGAPGFVITEVRPKIIP